MRKGGPALAETGRNTAARHQPAITAECQRTFVQCIIVPPPFSTLCDAALQRNVCSVVPPSKQTEEPHDYERSGAMRYLNVEGNIAWRANPLDESRLADAEREVEDDMADFL